MTQAISAAEPCHSDHYSTPTYSSPLQVSSGAPASQDLPSGSSTVQSRASVSSSSAEISSKRDPAQQASWASLHRALDAAHNARHQHMSEQEQPCGTVPGVDDLPSDASVAVQTQHQLDASTPKPWENVEGQVGANDVAAQSFHPDEGTKFGHRSHERAQNDRLGDNMQAEMHSPSAAKGYSFSEDVWLGTVPMSTSNSQASVDQNRGYSNEPLPMPCYPTSNNNSPSDEISNTLGQFMLNSTPPMTSPTASTAMEQLRKPERPIDIASRRKAPRPAALGPAALGPAAMRSSSYGSQSALSSTFRPGRTSQHPQWLRHAKSVGHNLNVRYAGIRKPSSAQRSPLNIATFAEADEFNNVVAQPGMASSLDLGVDGAAAAAAAPPTPVSSEDTVKSRLATLEERTLAEAQETTPHQVLLNGQPTQLTMVSPPSTPLNPDYLMQSQMQSLMPPLSAPPQYALFPDYTPPYSAGPLTASSWSDAPLTSPEIAAFPPNAHGLSQQPFKQPSLQDYGLASSFTSHQHPFVPIEQKLNGATPPSNSDQPQTEFLIQEFPRQKEEHAHAAQQMSSQKPKNYVFANATPNDF